MFEKKGTRAFYNMAVDMMTDVFDLEAHGSGKAAGANHVRLETEVQCLLNLHQW